LLGAMTGVLGLAGVAVVGANLDRLVDTPARWGTDWDVAVSLVDSPPPGTEPVDREMVIDDRDVAAAAMARFDEQVTIAGHDSLAVTFDQVKGDLGPTVIDGRAPRGDDEVAVGRETLDQLGVPLGARVEITSRSDAREQFHIVGVVLFPTVNVSFPLAKGAAFTQEGGDRLQLGDPDRDDAGFQRMLIRWAPGTGHGAALERLVSAAGGPPEGEEPLVDRPVAPPEVNGLRDVKLFPAAAAAALVVLGVISTSHALIVTVRRRRAELGVLSALGFTPRQRWLVIASQATTVGCVALVIGVPLGAVAGRLAWTAIADSMGVAADVAFPLGLLAVGVPAVLVVLNLIGAVPARAAARLRAAEALRSE
jgi:putative ABC transport system permease protein